MRRTLPFLLPARLGLQSPLQLPGLQAWHDMSDLGSLDYDGSNRIRLAADKSGNSQQNCLTLNGVTGNYASSPDQAAFDVTTALSIVFDGSVDNLAQLGEYSFVIKADGHTGPFSYSFALATTGVLVLRASNDGNYNGTAFNAVSTVPITGIVSNLQSICFGVSWTANVAKFWTAQTGTLTHPGGAGWTQLGADVTATLASIFNSTSAMRIGERVSGLTANLTGRCKAVRVYASTNGTNLIWSPNFTTQAKFTSSFTETSSTASTVTINTTGDTGARICGDRDLVQPTNTKKFILTIDPFGNYATGDGVNDFYKSAAYLLGQPCTVYFVGSHLTWTSGNTIYDGGTNNTGHLQQDTSTPRLRAYAGTSLSNIQPALNNRFIAIAGFNSTNGSLRLNRNAPVLGNVGAANMNGFTLGAVADASSPANITVSEVLIYAAPHDLATQERVFSYLARKWRVAA